MIVWETLVQAATVWASLRAPFGRRVEDFQMAGSSRAEYSFTAYPDDCRLVESPTERKASEALDLPAYIDPMSEDTDIMSIAVSAISRWERAR